MSLNKAQKLVKIVELLERRGGVRAMDIKDRYELDGRSFRRYMADIRDLGLPLQDEGIGSDRIISLDPTYRRTGVQLTLSEVLSLHFGRRLFTFLNGTQFASDMDDAIERLEPAISRAHADLASQLDRKFMAVPEHAKDYSDMGDLIDDLITALIYDNPIKASYKKANGDEKQYTLEPLTLATYRQGLYLFARDQADHRFKSFAVERFTDLSRVRVEHFVPPDNFDAEEIIKDAFGIVAGRPQNVVARFSEQVAPYIQERKWHQTQTIETLDSREVRCSFSVGITHELIQWLLGFAGDVTVESPPELIDIIRDHHITALKNYSVGAKA
jgi:predicted DNA-binding transcriptional regulator YafY